MARLIVNPHVLRCFLRPSLTEAPFLRRSYPASSVLRTSPPPNTARPGSRELPVDPDCDHRWGFPCCAWSTMSACRRHYPGRIDETDSLVPFPRRRPSPHYSWVGSCITSFEACSAFTHVTTCRLAKSPYATLYTGGSGGFVASTAAPIATGWSDPVPGRAFHPAVVQRLFTAHCNGDVTPTTRMPTHLLLLDYNQIRSCNACATRARERYIY